MKVKVKVTGKGTRGDPYRPDIQAVNFSAIEYNIQEGWVIIEIKKEDYKKIKDKVIEVIEE